MIKHFKRRSDYVAKHLFVFENKKPKWNDDFAANVLDFSGGVTMSSVKKFQFVQKDNQMESLILQFGQIGRDEFSVDVKWPFLLLQASAIALSSFDFKIACG